MESAPTRPQRPRAERSPPRDTQEMFELEERFDDPASKWAVDERFDVPEMSKEGLGDVEEYLMGSPSQPRAE